MSAASRSALGLVAVTAAITFCVGPFAWQVVTSLRPEDELGSRGWPRALTLASWEAVLVGRPYVYGLALAGEAGVREVIRNMIAEFDLTLALCGRTSAAGLDRDCLLPD